MIHPAAKTNPARGEIWSVRFDPKVGHEIGKVRPALVIGLNSIGRLPLRIVVPITDWKQSYATSAWFVYLAPNQTNGLSKDSGADAFQVKSVAVARFTKRRGTVSTQILDEVAAAVALCVGYRP